jgi:SAM-dependent methyltransferase
MIFIGKSSNVLNRFRLQKKNLAISMNPNELYDKTGMVGSGVEQNILWDKNGVMVIEYESLAHTLWRAQEFSLINSVRADLLEPIADFGCGDGSFSRALFKELTYGIDNDPSALNAAKKTGLYSSLIRSRNNAIPLADGVLGSIFANSVLEHLSDLDAQIAEFHRILKPNGVLLITVPTLGFKRHLHEYFGEDESIKVNEQYCHYNLFEVEEWMARFERAGFLIRKCVQYQNKEFTFMYMMARLAGKRGLGFFIPNLSRMLWSIFRKQIIKAITNSIGGIPAGANVLIIAVKKVQSDYA